MWSFSSLHLVMVSRATIIQGHVYNEANSDDRSSVICSVLVTAAWRYNIKPSPLVLASPPTLSSITTYLPELHIPSSPTRPASCTRVQSPHPRSDCGTDILITDRTRSGPITLCDPTCQHIHRWSSVWNEKYGSQCYHRVVRYWWGRGVSDLLGLGWSFAGNELYCLVYRWR